jgi:hypothetical protein
MSMSQILIRPHLSPDARQRAPSEAAKVCRAVMGASWPRSCRVAPWLSGSQTCHTTVHATMSKSS